jgi:alcohol dehydrogenase (cytochrome c)
METSPIVVNGVMYVTTSFSHVYALDAKTGEELWHYKHKLGRSRPLLRPEQSRRRGLRRQGLSRHARRQAGRARCQDRQQVVWQPTSPIPRTRLQRDDGADRRQGQGADRHQRRRIRHPRLRQGLRRQDGKLLWTFDTIPENSVGVWARRTRPAATCIATSRPRKAQLAKIGDPYKTLGGGVWQNPAVDLATNRIYFVVGNPSPDLDGSLRPGDNLYTDSLVSLDLDTGKYACHFQYIAARRVGSRRRQPAVLVDVARTRTARRSPA